MFVSIHSEKKLKQLRRNFFITGAFLLTGGIVAIARELQMPDALSAAWFYAAIVLAVAGMVCIAVSKNYILLNETYFSMNPNRLSFRVTFLGKEHVLEWVQLAAVRVTGSKVVFELHDGNAVTLRLSNIPDEQTARHIRASIGLAAMQQNIKVNNVITVPDKEIIAL